MSVLVVFALPAALAEDPPLMSQSSVSVTGNGTVTAVPSSFPSGTVTQIVFTATPAADHAFFRWSGDAVPYACDRGTNLTITTSESVEIQAVFGEALYVDGSSGAPMPDGSVAAPYTLIQEAIDVAPDYATVFVAPGTYFAANSTTDTVVTVLSKIALRSLEGRDTTLLSAFKSPVITRRALAVANSDAYVCGFTLTNGYDNTKAWSGAMLDISAGVVEDCFISQCTYMWVGAYVTVRNSGCVRNCVITGHAESTFEEGTSHVVYIAGNGLVENCLISYDSTGNVVGGVTPVYMWGTAARLRNCLVVDNRIGPGYFRLRRDNEYAAVYLRDGQVEGCTIANNRGDRGCAGLHIDPLASASISSVRNCIIQGSSGLLTDLNVDGKTSLISYSLSPDLEDGINGNILGCAVFVDPANGDYRLRACSPGIDAGMTSETLGRFDYYGAPRVAGAAPDMGACEFNASVTPECVIDVEAAFGRAPFTTAFKARHAGFSGTPECLWTFSDGGTAQGLSVQHTFTEPGAFTASLAVSDGAVDADALPLQVLSVPETVFVAIDGSHVAPFSTPATASTNVQEALDLRPATVRVGPGTYTAMENCGFSIAAGSATHLIGEDRDTTILAANSKYTLLRRGVQLLDPDSIFEGITISNAWQGDYRANGDPGVAYLYAGTLRNCRTVGEIRGYRSAGIRAENYARIEDCLFGARYNANNTGAQAQHVTFLCLTGNASADRCVISNTYVYATGQAATPWSAVVLTSSGASLRNSLITQNTRTTYDYSGAVMIWGSGHVENCTIVSNAFYGIGSGLLITNVTGSSVISCRNNIVSGNILTLTTNEKVDSGVTYPDYHSTSCAPELTTGVAGNIAESPLLTADYRLGSDSPCISKGVKLDWMTPEALDLGRLPRIRNRFPDMGAYERQVSLNTTILVR